LRLERGQLAVLARESDPALNGGLPAPLLTFDISLANSASSAAGGGPAKVELRSGEVVVDRVSYSTSSPGVSLQRDPAQLEAGAAPLFCNAPEDVMPFGAGDRGTPGRQNARCP
jgi:hypothetical protein